MIISIGKDFYEINKLSFDLGGFYLNNKRVNFKNHHVLVQLTDSYFDLSELMRVVKKGSGRDSISFELVPDLEQLMYIEYEYGSKGLSFIKIFLHENLINNFSEKDILVFIFHEIGHLLDINHSISNSKKLKIIKLLTFFILIGVSTYLKSLYLILFNLCLYWFLIKYIEANMSRRQEYYADSYAVKISGHVNNVVSALKKLNIYSGDHDAGIFSSHPSLKQRINYLKIKYFWHYFLK